MSDPVFATVTVCGAGTMGAGIAQICAQAGSAVRLFDIQQDFVDAGVQRMAAFLAKGVAKGKMSDADSQAVQARVTATTDFDAAVDGAELVVEAIPEDVALKNDLFKRAAAGAGAVAVLATNTSSLSLAQIFQGVPHAGRCVGTHFFNPPPIMPLLEIVKPLSTDEATVDRVLAYATQLGKDPIVVKDSPGFATSRLGVVLGLEAIRMVEAEVASPEDIDKAMELGYRHPMGPLKLTDLVGLDVRLAIADYLRQELDSPAFEVPQLMRDMVAKGQTGKKAGQGFYSWE